MYDISILGWVAAFFAALFIGMGKTGLTGAGNIAIPLMAYYFGGKVSTGIILPMLCIADIFAVLYYHRHAEWKQIIKLLPYALSGVLIAVFVGNVINDRTFKTIIGILILASVMLMFWQDYRKEKFIVPKKQWYAGVFGLSGGFATMIGNAAGPIMAIYLQTMRLSKNTYIGTGAWFFLIINFSKMPLQIFVWNNITWQSISFNALLIPAIALGAYLGVVLVKLLPEKAYRIFILVSTAVSALLLI